MVSSMTEGVVRSLGVNISQPPTSGLFLTQSMLNTATSIVIFFLNFFNFWPCWVFVSVRGLSLVAASGGHSSSR